MKHFTGMEYLKIDIGNHYGLDKEQFKTRINWVNKHEDILEKLSDKADNIFQYNAAVMAYRKAQNKKPIGYLVGLDACASGAQVMSALSGCKVGAMNTGLTGRSRKDIYGIVTDIMNEILETGTQYDRAVIKAALMTFYYGSKKQPKLAFGEDTPELEAFYTAQQMVAPGASMLMPILIGAWQPFVLEHIWDAADGFIIRKKVTEMMDAKIEVNELDGASFMYRYEKNQGTETGLSLAADVVHSVDGFICREMGRRCNYNPNDLMTVEEKLQKRVDEQTNFEPIEFTKIEKTFRKHNMMSLVGVEHLLKDDAHQYSILYCHKLLELIQRTIVRPSFPVIMIHDNFECHPNYMNTVRQTYIDIFAEIADSTILNAVLTDITGVPTEIPKLSNNLSSLIRNGEYALS